MADSDSCVRGGFLLGVEGDASRKPERTAYRPVHKTADFMDGNRKNDTLSMKRTGFMDGNRGTDSLSMKRTGFMDGNRETDSLSMKRTGFMDKSRATGKMNEF